MPPGTLQLLYSIGGRMFVRRLLSTATALTVMGGLVFALAPTAAGNVSPGDVDSLYAVGRGDSGQLGAGGTYSTFTPLPVAGVLANGATSVASSLFTSEDESSQVRRQSNSGQSQVPVARAGTVGSLWHMNPSHHPVASASSATELDRGSSSFRCGTEAQRGWSRPTGAPRRDRCGYRDQRI